MKRKEQEKNNSNVIIIVLATVIAILLIVIGFLTIKGHFLDDYSERYNDREIYDDGLDDGEEETIPKNPDSTTENNSTPDNTNKYITKTEALNIALKDLKISQSNIYDVSVELDYKYNQTVYDIDFNYKNYEYEYYVNATSGKIIHSFRERD